MSVVPPRARANLIATVRETMLVQLLRVVAVFGLLAALALLFVVPNRVEDSVFPLFFGGIALVTALIAFLPGLPFALRAFTGLTLLFFAGLLELFRVGLEGNGPLWLLAFVLFTVLFAGARPGIVAALTAIPLALAFGIAIDRGLVAPEQAILDGFRSGDGWPAMLFVLIVLLSGLVVGLNRLLRQLESSTADEAALAARLEQERRLLELRVTNRSRALETSARLATRLARILDQTELMGAVVNDVRRSFHYDNVKIYLLPPRGTALRLVGASGGSERQMLARGHEVPLGHGLIGRAAATGRTILAPDVSAASDWVPDELLPETRSEIAVPLLIGRRVAGVLDVQQNRAGALSADDLAPLETIAAQVGIALQNANLFANARRRAELAALQVEAGQAIRRTRSVEDALRVTSQMLGDLLDADQSAVLLTGSRSDAPRGSAA